MVAGRDLILPDNIREIVAGRTPMDQGRQAREDVGKTGNN